MVNKKSSAKSPTYKKTLDEYAIPIKRVRGTNDNMASTMNRFYVFKVMRHSDDPIYPPTVEGSTGAVDNADFYRKMIDRYGTTMLLIYKIEYKNAVRGQDYTPLGAELSYDYNYHQYILKKGNSKYRVLKSGQLTTPGYGEGKHTVTLDRPKSENVLNAPSRKAAFKLACQLCKMDLKMGFHAKRYVDGTYVVMGYKSKRSIVCLTKVDGKIMLVRQDGSLDGDVPARIMDFIKSTGMIRGF